MWIFVIGVGLYLLVSLVDTANKKPGLLYLLALPIAIITLPLKLAFDMLGGGRGRRRRRW